MMSQDLPSFDELLKMAQQHPAEFERWRQQAINDSILSAPAPIRRRLQGVQFQIDAQRQIHPSPMGACIKISTMMHESVDTLNDLLHDLSTAPNLHQAHSLTSLQPGVGRKAAEIIEFSRH